MTVQRSGSAILGALLAAVLVLAGGGQALAAPDLKILDFQGPPQAPLNEPLVLTVVVKNVGDAPSPPTTIDFLMDNQPAPIKREPLDSLQLQVEQSKVVVVQLPPGVPAGAHQLHVKIDPRSVNETPLTTPDNRATRAIQLVAGGGPGLPGIDLAATGLQAPLAATIGESFPVTASVENMGSATSNQTVVKVFIRRDSPFFEGLLAEGPLGPISPENPRREIPLTATLPQNVTTGHYAIGVFIDPQSSGDSPSTTANNKFVRQDLFEIKPGTTQPPAGINLAMESVDAAFSATVPGNIFVGARFRNLGGTAAGPFAVRFLLSTDTVFNPPGAGGTGDRPFGDNIPFAGLAPAESRDLTLTLGLPSDLQPGQYVVFAVVDAAQLITETNEADNVRGATHATQINNQTPSGSPDLVVEGVTITSATTPTAGATVNVGGGIKNGGSGGAPGFGVQFFLSTDQLFDLPSAGNPGDRPLFLAPLPRPPLGSLAVSTFATDVKLPGDLPPGEYYVALVADVTKNVTETNEANNTRFTAQPFFVQGQTTGDRPDLVSQNLTAPETATAGSPFGLRVEVRNAGTAASGGFGVGFALSTDTEFDPPNPSAPSDLVIAEMRRPALAAGAVDVITTSPKIPASLAAGAYFTLMAADRFNEVAEIDENNNDVSSLNATRIAAQPNFQPPDLVADSVSPAPVTSAGALLSVSSAFHNAGGGPAPDWAVRFFLSSDSIFNPPAAAGAGGDVPLGEPIIRPTLPATGSDQFSASVFVPQNVSPGDYFVVAVANPAKVFGELTYDNNTVFSPNRTQVRGSTTTTGTGPDLVAVAVGGSPVTTAGSTLTISAAVENAGSGASGPFGVQFLLQSATNSTAAPIVLGEQFFPGLASRTPLNFTTDRIVPTFVAGEFFLRLDVDLPGNRVAELNESNNQIRSGSSVTVQPPQNGGGGDKPDLIVTAVGGPSTGTPGGQYPFNATILNQGRAAAGSFRVGFGFSLNQFLPANGGPPYGSRLADVVVPGLQPGQSFDVFQSVTLPANVGEGTYFPAAGADDPSFGVAEGNELNNYLVSAGAVSIRTGQTIGDQQPDLAAAEVSPRIFDAKAGQPIEAGVVVKNVGTISVPQFEVGLLLDSDPNSATPMAPRFLKKFFAPGLSAGGAFRSTETVQLPLDLPAGFYFLRLEADPGKLIGESNEFNNSIRSFRGINVGSGQTVNAPNLTFTAVGGPSTATIGQMISVSAEVTNTGSAPAGRFAVAFNLASSSAVTGDSRRFFLGEVPLPGLAANSGTPVTTQFFVPGFMAPGLYKVAALADSQGFVNESNEGDNERGAPNTTDIGGTASTALPDLVSLECGGDTTAQAGGFIAVRGVVANRENTGFAPGFPVGFALTASDAPLDSQDESTGLVFLGATFVGEGMQPGTTRPVFGHFPVPATVAPGQYLLAMYADHDRQIPELDESNNSRFSRQRVSVFGSGATQFLDLDNREIRGPLSPVTVGSQIQATAFFIARGLQTAIDVPLAFQFFTDSGEFQALTTSVRVNPSGQDTSVFTTVTLFVPPLPTMAGVTPKYALSYVIDPNFRIQEPHHNNRSPNPFPLPISGSTSGGQPNLVAVSVLNPPSQGQPGSVLGIAGQVRNGSTFEVFRPFALEFSLVGGGQIGTFTDFIHLGRAGVDHLSPSESVTRTLAVPLPPLRPGGYKVQMRVDPENFVFETNEGDNVVDSLGAMTVGDQQAGVTDLVAVGVTGPTSAELGALMPIAGEVVNRGANPSPGFGVSFVLSTQSTIELGNFAFGTQFVPSLAAGESRVVTGQFPLPPFFKPGSYFLGMVVDSGNLVAETDERNNVARSFAPLAITAPTSGGKLVDLAALSVSARPASPTASAAFPGERLLVTGQVENVTTQAVPIGFDVAFFATREQILSSDGAAAPVVGENFPMGRLPVPGIGGEEVRELRFETNIPPFVRPGPYFIAMVVDPDGRLPELAETRGNNKVLSANPLEVTTPEYLKEIPDLVATGVFGQSQGTAGQDFTIKWSGRGENIRRPVDFHVIFMAQPDQNFTFQTGQALNVASDGEVRRYLPIGRVKVHLEAAASTPFGTATVVKLPPELTAGQYTIAMAIDPENVVPEFDKQNNFLDSPVPVQILAGQAEQDDHADNIAEVQPGRDGLAVDVPPIMAGLQKKQPLGDRDVFVFATATGKFYEVGVGLEGLFDSILEIRDKTGRAIRRDLGQGRGSHVSFQAEDDGPYYAIVSAPFSFQTGTYLIGVKSFAGRQDKADIVPGPISVKPEIATSSTELTAFFSVGNGGSAPAAKFNWELRLETHVEQADLLFRQNASATVIATGTVENLPPFTGRPIPPVNFGPLPEGRYDLVLSVDTGNEVDEQEEGNNSRPAPFGVGRVTDDRFARTDLVPALVQINPFRPGTSDTIEVKTAVANRGGTPVTTFTVSLYLDRTAASNGTLLTTLTIDHMAPDSVFPLKPVTFGPLTEGQHNVVVFVDDGNAIGEIVEENNTRVHEFFVSGTEASGYDLVIEHAAVVPGDPEQGQPLDLGVLLANRGATGSPGCVLRAYVDPEASADGALPTTPTTVFTLDGIGARQVRKVGPLPLPAFASVGQHKVVVRIDSSDPSNVEQNTGNNQVTLEISVGERRIGATQFVVNGLVLDSSGNPVGPGFKVRAINKARRAVSSPSVTPSSSSEDGSFSTTFGGLGANRFLVVDGDTLVFEVLSDKGERLQVSDPASRVVTAGEVQAGEITQDLLTAPPAKEDVTVEILKPDENARFFPDDKIEFRGQGTDEDGNRLSGRRLVWSLGNPPRTIGVGESFALDAKRLKPGRNEIALKAIGRGLSNTARRSIYLEDAVEDTDRLAIYGKVRSAPRGEVPTEPLTLTIRNVTRGLEVASEVDRATGRYSVEFTSAETAVAAPGDKFEARLTTTGGVSVAVAPPVFSIGRRGIAAGEHERDFRSKLEPPVGIDLLPGVNLISVPLRPVTNDGTDYDAGALSRDMGLDWVVRTETGADGQPRFRVFLPDLTPGFNVTGNEGYICSRGNRTEREFQFRGVQWEEEQADREVGRGVNTIGYPRDVPENHDSRDLAEQLGASFVVQTGRDPATGRGTFQPFVPGSTGSFEIRRGMGYLLGSPQSAPLTLESNQ
ncbi:MAG: hypothetical protein HY816_10965 [Candidatus Wallbacteria bacterium]|nr:hypothetical protein [Candidatus Wallbacteria bacterium]